MACMKSRTCSKKIIDQQDVLDFRKSELSCAVRLFFEIYSKRSCDICSLSLYVQLGLGSGPSPSHQCPAVQRSSQLCSNFACNDFRLVVTSTPSSYPVQRHRHHAVNIPESFRRSQAGPENLSEMTPDVNPSFILYII